MKKIIIFGVLILVLFLGVGYSAFNQELILSNIGLFVRIKKDIRITDLSIDTFNGSNATYEYNVSNIVVDSKLPNIDSYIKLKVQITNIGNTREGIYNITGLPDNLQIIENYQNEEICEENKCTLGISKDIYLTIKYKDNKYNQDNTNYNFNLSFNFREVYEVIFTGFDNLSNMIVYDGDNLKINIGPNIDTSFLTFKINGVVSPNYSYDPINGTIESNNISGNIEIIKNNLSNFNFVIDSIQNEYNSNLSSYNSILVSNFLNENITGINTSDLIIKRIDVIIDYKSKTGSNQSINCILSDGINTYTKEVPITGKTTSSITVTFDNLNINKNDTFIISYSKNNLTNSNIDITGEKIKIYIE